MYVHLVKNHLYTYILYKVNSPSMKIYKGFR